MNGTVMTMISATRKQTEEFKSSGYTYTLEASKKQTHSNYLNQSSAENHMFDFIFEILYFTNKKRIAYFW